ncbi:sugar kinase [Saccharospirillum sp. MSK14-1]|uniref:sugar kinase n=1 Tax=Saccharospirillum sp. MSK14-1 TaxID=1897632 RepID=UPI000D39C455|nr:sugar kinase [Saccharospirillum sp. MSK14-1]PTY38257.1 sugar kinase [Saccharospirillum sp. MSK14-1]
MSQSARFVLIERKTRLTELVERFNTWSQARFYLEHANADVNDYLQEHDRYQKALSNIEITLRAHGRVARLERALLDTYQFHSEDIILVVGQDGLVANTLKYLQGQPVIAINPDPQRWDGPLLPFTVEDAEQVVVDTLAGHASIKTASFAEATTKDGQRMLAVNDLFIGPKTHSSARYSLAWNGQQEVQSSSGIIVSTGLGSTGWLQSILAGAAGISGQAVPSDLKGGFSWEADYLYYSVREPFPSQTTGTDMVMGRVTAKNQLVLTSFMPMNGLVFSDGIESDGLEFNAGTELTIGLADVRGCLVARS